MKKITVSIQADIELVATEEEENLINEMNEASLIDDDYETYDKLSEKLDNLIEKRIENEILKGAVIVDTNWD